MNITKKKGENQTTTLKSSDLAKMQQNSGKK
jgi:hypothetical protein